MSDNMTAGRLVELETRLSYQEDSIQVLSDTVARQQQQIDMLQALSKQLIERLRNMSDPAQKLGATDDEVPPHY